MCEYKKNTNTARKLKKKITDKKYFCHYLSLENFLWKLQLNIKISFEILSVFLTCKITKEITHRMLVDDYQRNLI